MVAYRVHKTYIILEDFFVVAYAIKCILGRGHYYYDVYLKGSDLSRGSRFGNVWLFIWWHSYSLISHGENSFYHVMGKATGDVMQADYSTQPGFCSSGLVLSLPKSIGMNLRHISAFNIGECYSKV